MTVLILSMLISGPLLARDLSLCKIDHVVLELCSESPVKC